MSEEVFEVSERNEYRHLVQDEDDEVRYVRHRQYVSPLLVLSRRCISLIVLCVLSLLLLASYLGYVAKTPPHGAAEVRTPCGLYKGNYKDGAYSFKGIRYGASTEGPLRWAPPVEAECHSETVHDATTNRSRCAQVFPMTNSSPPAGSEDCLFLNVWTPRLRPASLLPVMVWIHGGYLTAMYATLPVYSPTEKLSANTGMVFVSMNYRLNAFGFMALEILRSPATNNSTGNYGFMDQILALKWIQKNIHLFGGDPNKVTIIGQSSGGTCVLALMASPLAKGLFSGAVALSGGYVLNATVQDAEKDNLAFLKNTGCKDAACLRNLTMEQVLKAIPWDGRPGWAFDPNTDLPTPGKTPPNLAIVDGYVLPDAPFAMWERGEGGFSDVPFLIGSTEQETDYYPTFLNLSDWTWDDYHWFVTEGLSAFNKTLVKLALDQYPSSRPCPTTTRCPERAYTTMVSDIRVSCPYTDMAKRAAAALRSPVFRYIVTHTPTRAITPTGLTPFPSRFAFHCMDPDAFFLGLDLLLGSPLAKPDQNFQELLTYHLTHFAKHGKMVEEWPEFPSGIGLLSENLTVVSSDAEIISRCALWEGSGLFAYAWAS